MAFGVYLLVGKTFMPTMDEGDIIVGIEKLPSVSLEETAALDLKIHQALMAKVPEVVGVVARAGSDEIGLDPMGLNQTDTFLILKPRDEWRPGGKQAMMEKLRAVLDDLPGVKYSFTQPIDMRVSEMIIGVRGDIAIKMFGPDLDTLNGLAIQIEALMKTVPGNQDVYTVQNDGVQYLRVVVDRLAAGRHGLSVEDVQDALRIQIEGQRAGDASGLEVNAIEADTAGIRGRLSAAESEQRKALARLRIRFPGADTNALALAEPGPIGEPEEVWEARILRTSDPLRIAQVELDQAELAVSRSRANRLPDPTFGLYTASEVYSNENIIGVNVTIPIPGRYRNRQLGRALAQVDMARAARDRQQRLMEIEVAEGYADATGNFERWRLAEESAAKTRESARLTQRAYSLGEVDLQALLLSRRQAVEAMDSALDARVMALKSYYRLLVDAHLVWGLEHG